MNFEQFRQQVKVEIFDYQLLESYLQEFKKPRDKVSALISEGKIIRIKKGLYIFGDNWRKRPLELEMVANVIYGPSCISFEYALSHYGLISERSAMITSLTIGDNKLFHTPLGTFEYKAIDKEKFKIGIDYYSLGDDGGYYIACKEKALVDLVYKTPNIRTLEQLRYYLFEEMRVDKTLFYTFDGDKLNEISKCYKKISVNLIGQLYENKY